MVVGGMIVLVECKLQLISCITMMKNEEANNSLFREVLFLSSLLTHSTGKRREEGR